jgi:hypothetical protein
LLYWSELRFGDIFHVSDGRLKRREGGVIHPQISSNYAVIRGGFVNCYEPHSFACSVCPYEKQYRQHYRNEGGDAATIDHLAGHSLGCSADLRGRRHDLGIGVRDMAAGLGVGMGRLLTMEDGTATEEDKTFHRTWLSRIEGWSSSQRHMQLGRANAGQRFT